MAKNERRNLRAHLRAIDLLFPRSEKPRGRPAALLVCRANKLVSPTFARNEYTLSSFLFLLFFFRLIGFFEKNDSSIFFPARNRTRRLI